VGPYEFKNTFENQICSELNWLQTLAPMLQKFEKKYGVIGFDVRNKLCYRIFFKFKMKFELKIRKSKGAEIFEFQLRYLENSKILETLPKNYLITPSCI
jgi:hypothetical protein